MHLLPRVSSSFVTVTCWPTPGSDMVTVNLEYELMQTDLQLQDVEIYVPIP